MKELMLIFVTAVVAILGTTALQIATKTLGEAWPSAVPRYETTADS
jgi:hypothetical protein